MKAIGKKLLRGFVKAPWESELMEFEHGLWRGVSPLYTESGRQLGEENTRPFLFNDHIPAKTIQCKYEGSRAGCPINMSALKIAMTNFDATLDITKAVIRYHARAAKSAGISSRGGVWDLYIVSLASIALIAYRVRKSPRDPASATIPDDLASQYQFIAGIFMICRHMISEDSVYMQGNGAITATEMYDYADRHEIFTSFNGMVCAGSTKKILEFLEFCIEHTEAAFRGIASEHSESDFAALMSVTDDIEGWYRYAMHSIGLDCFIKLNRVDQKLCAADAAPSDHCQTRGTLENLSSYIESFSGVPREETDNCFKSGALARQNLILKSLNKNPIKSISNRLVAEQLSYD